MVVDFPVPVIAAVLLARPTDVFLGHSYLTWTRSSSPGGGAMLPCHSRQLQDFGAILSIRLERVSTRHTVCGAS